MGLCIKKFNKTFHSDFRNGIICEQGKNLLKGWPNYYVTFEGFVSMFEGLCLPMFEGLCLPT